MGIFVDDSGKVYEKVSGVIERITFHNEENGWSVIRVSPFDLPEKIITVVTHQPQIIAGDTMDFYGDWITHPKFGKQFKAEQAVSKKPANANALEKYLGSGLIFGVGPKTAHKIVKFFGKDTLTVFDSEIERLMEVPGIGENKLQQIKEAWEEHKAIKDVMIFLQSYGISTLYSVKIYKQYGNDAIATVSLNPYILSRDIYGIGFFSADKIAKNLGFAPDSFERISAGVKHILDASRENGHCYLTKEQIFSQTLELLALESEDIIEEPLLKLMEKKEISIRVMENEEIYYYSNSLYWDEVNFAKNLKEILTYKPEADIERVKRWIKNYCEQIKMELSEEQFNCAVNVANQGFSIITGGPGCGKTTTTKVIVKLFEVMKKNILLAAPTGRAAQRMSEVIGKEAVTIHRLLSWNPQEGKFEKNKDNPLKVKIKDFSGNITEENANVLIVDETSMLDISLGSALLKAIPPKCQVIFIGDPDQLPSVGPGNVIHDLLSCENIKKFSLTKIFRQAQESKIITCAHEINSGNVPVIDTPVKNNSLFGSKTDCLFIDSDEATQEQLKFIKRAKLAINDYQNGGNLKVFMKDDIKNVVEKNESGEMKVFQTVREIQEPYDTLVIPQKLMNANLDKLISSQNSAQELLSVINRIPPFSTLYYGMTASQSVLRLVSETLPKHYPGMEIQILSPMIRGSLGVANLNKEIQNKINPYKEGKGQIIIGERILRTGDRVIQSVNNYDLKIHNSKEKGIFNGEIGKIYMTDSANFSCIIDFGTPSNPKMVTYEKSDLTELSLAYAVTIHKSQGSEFPIVVIPLLTQHFTMLYRNLIYTGLTRAKKLCVFVGSRKALAMAVQKTDTKERQTTLKFLMENVQNII